jgi:hypothetical protein
LTKNIVLKDVHHQNSGGGVVEAFILGQVLVCNQLARMVSMMKNMVIKAIEIVRQKLHVAAKNAKYDFQSEEVQRINARLDKLVCRFMKTKKLKEL